MLEQNILIGGEESGGIGTSLYLPERDATVSALLLAELMAWHGKSLGELVDALHAEFGEHRYGRIDLDVTRRQKKRPSSTFPMASCSGCSTGRWCGGNPWMESGYLGDIGWVMVRASGTEICCVSIPKQPARKPRRKSCRLQLRQFKASRGSDANRESGREIQQVSGLLQTPLIGEVNDFHVKAVS